jgi:hypothetical protein
LASFLTHSRQLYANGNAKLNLFLPRDGKRLSVFRIEGLTEVEVQRLGETHLKSPAPFGHADSLGATILDIGLGFDPDNTPERHAHIVGWPETKHEQRQLALRISSLAVVIKYPRAHP